MLTGEVHSIPVTSITVSPTRQRQDFRNMEELEDSIRQVGLINPIVVTPDLVLVAGERRLRACKALGLTHVPAQYTTELSPEDAELIELEENIKREDLSWKETVQSIARLYTLKQRNDPEWTLAKASTYLSLAASTISNNLLVASYLDEGEPLVVEADKYSVALNAARRREERRDADEEQDVDESLDNLMDSALSLGNLPKPKRARVEEQEPASEKPDPTAGPEAPIHLLDFYEWATTPIVGPKINFLHCDFPYGINYHTHGAGAARSMGAYDDSPEAFRHCMDALHRAMPGHIAESAHLLFWFSARLDMLAPVFETLNEMGWKMNPYPLIWHRSDNSGILSDPSRGPRHIYELALLGSRGDRKIVQAVSNLIPSPKTKEVHPSEKPRPVLAHFFRMFVDDTTVMLDPTCGSANSVIVAEAMGARHAMGLEADPAIHKSAVRNYKRNVGED